MPQGEQVARPTGGGGSDATGSLLFKLINQGRSFSGRERNCCFLNTGRLGAGQFADISAASGLDFFDDGRAVGRVDWDHDGDLDFWIVNRNGPQVRFLRNEVPRRHHFLALRLQGRSCNRDAIGARVELHLSDEGHEGSKVQNRELIKTLRAGDGFLSQSSKWLHFGLGNAPGVQRVVVHWPGGDAETFVGFELDRHYRIVQHGGRPVPFPRRPPLPPWSSVDLPFDTTTDVTRVVSLTRVPLPRLSYKLPDGHVANLTFTGRPVLLNLWASWCAPCVVELKGLTRRAEELREAGLDVLALSVEAMDKDDGYDVSTARQLIQRLAFPHPWAMASPETIEKLQFVHDHQFDWHRSLPVPTSMLIDGQGRLAVLYKGPIKVERVLADMAHLVSTPETLRRASLPFAGRWHDAPRGQLLVPLVRRLLDAGYVDDAVSYALKHQAAISHSHEYPRLLSRIAMVLVDSDDKQLEAEALARQAANLAPEDSVTQGSLGHVLETRGDLDLALEHYSKALTIKPESAKLHANVGYLLLELNHHQASIDHLRKAIELEPTLAEAHHNLGNVLQRQGDLDAAIDHYRRASDLSPQIGTIHASLADAFQAQGQFEASLAPYQRALEIDGDDVGVHRNLGLALGSLNRLQDAEYHFRQVLKLRPGTPDAHVDLGLALRFQGKTEEAVDQFRAALELDANHVAARGQLKQLRDLKGDLVP